MGAQASKQATRRLPRQAKPETLSSRPTESPSTVRQQQDPSFDKPLEEGFDNEQLLKNLRAIGPVKIDPTTTKMRTSDKMLHIIKERQRIEEDEDLGRISSMPNRATIDVIFSALERRKHLSPGELEKVLPQLQNEYKIEQSTLKTLFKYYNTMAVMPALSDEEGARRQGIWVNDKQEWNRALDETIARKKALVDQAEQKSKSSSTASGDSSNRSQEKDPQQKRLEDLFED